MKAQINPRALISHNTDRELELIEKANSLYREYYQTGEVSTLKKYRRVLKELYALRGEDSFLPGL